MQTNPKVSIGMPVYNGQAYIRQALDSIVAQKFQDFELIISDNGSLDSTRKICEAYAAKDKRIRLYSSSENRGAAWNYNYVLKLANGQYFKWAAHDDLIAPDFLGKCVEVLDHSSDVVLAYCKAIAIDAQGKEHNQIEDDLHLTSPSSVTRFKQFQQRYRRKSLSNPVFGLMRISALRNTPGIRNLISADIILLGELSILGKFHEVPEYLFYRRYHSEMSCLANKSYEARAAWYDPANKGKLQFPRWRRIFCFFEVINRLPMGKYEKLQCYYQIVLCILWRIPGTRHYI